MGARWELPIRLSRKLAISQIDELSEPLPEWLIRQPVVARLIDHLGVSEFRRRLIHMSPGLFIIGLPLVPYHRHWLLILSGALVISIVCLTLAVRYRRFFTRQNEASWSSAVLGYFVPIVSALVIFPHRPEFGLLTLEIVAVGDGSATLGGMLLGGWRLPWNNRKTVSGLFCFIFFGWLMATFLYWGEASDVPFGICALICGTAAFCAGMVESLPVRSNDNFRVGITALLVGIAMSYLLA